MRWFGESWGAPVCVPINKCATPVGTNCVECTKPIGESDQGFVTPCLDGAGGLDELAWHLDCFLRNIGVRPHDID